MKQQQQPAAASGDESVTTGLSSELDLNKLADSLPSRLLLSLLAAAAGGSVAGPAAEVLSRLDAAAAAKNDYLALCKSPQLFPEVSKAPFLLDCPVCSRCRCCLDPGAMSVSSAAGAKAVLLRMAY